MSIDDNMEKASLVPLNYGYWDLLYYGITAMNETTYFDNIMFLALGLLTTSFFFQNITVKTTDDKYTQETA